MFPFKMAIRLIKSSSRQSIIIITTITLAVSVQFFIASLSSVLNNLILEQATTYQQHITITRDYSVSGRITPPNYEFIGEIRQISEVNYAFFGGSVTGSVGSDSREEQVFTFFIMDDYDNEGHFLDFFGLRFEQNIVRGRAGDPSKNEIMLDDYYAKRSNINIDDVVIIHIPTNDFKEEFSVVGTFDTGVFRSIRNYAYVSYDQVNSAPSSISAIYIQLDNPLEVDLVLDKILEIINKYDIEYQKVNTWKTSNPEVDLLDLAQKAVVFVIQVLITVATFVVIMSILNFSIQRKISQIGIIKAIGGSNKLISQAFVYKSLILTMVSTVLGLGIGSFSMWYYHNAMRYPNGSHRFVYQTTFISYLFSTLLVLLAVILATLASLRKVRKAKIIELIKT